MRGAARWEVAREKGNPQQKQRDTYKRNGIVGTYAVEHIRKNLGHSRADNDTDNSADHDGPQSLSQSKTYQASRSEGEA